MNDNININFIKNEHAEELGVEHIKEELCKRSFFTITLFTSSNRDKQFHSLPGKEDIVKRCNHHHTKQQFDSNCEELDFPTSKDRGEKLLRHCNWPPGWCSVTRRFKLAVEYITGMSQNVCINKNIIGRCIIYLLHMVT